MYQRYSKPSRVPCLVSLALGLSIDDCTGRSIHSIPCVLCFFAFVARPHFVLHINRLDRAGVSSRIVSLHSLCRQCLDQLVCRERFCIRPWTKS
ncbi:hypothetical protein BJX96DRAFT_144374 [Aspergillus floccosus]